MQIVALGWLLAPHAWHFLVIEVCKNYNHPAISKMRHMEHAVKAIANGAKCNDYEYDDSCSQSVSVRNMVRVAFPKRLGCE